MCLWCFELGLSAPYSASLETECCLLIATTQLLSVSFGWKPTKGNSEITFQEMIFSFRQEPMRAKCGSRGHLPLSPSLPPPPSLSLSLCGLHFLSIHSISPLLLSPSPLLFSPSSVSIHSISALPPFLSISPLYVLSPFPPSALNLPLLTPSLPLSALGCHQNLCALADNKVHYCRSLHVETIYKMLWLCCRKGRNLIASMVWSHREWVSLPLHFGIVDVVYSNQYCKTMSCLTHYQEGKSVMFGADLFTSPSIYSFFYP